MSFAAVSKLSGFIYVLYNNHLLNYIDIQQLYNKEMRL